MTKLERFEYAKNVLKWTCDENGNVFNKFNRIIGHKNRAGYLVSSIHISKNKRYSVLLHQFVYYFFKNELPELIDHVNKVKTDNRIDNLRIITKQQNCFNNLSKGYSYSKYHKKWRARIGIDYKRIHLGFFYTEEQAKDAYLKAKEKYHKI